MLDILRKKMYDENLLIDKRFSEMKEISWQVDI